MDMIKGILTLPVMFVAGGIIWTAFWMLAFACCIDDGSILGGM
jgi:hypothetical protein